MIEVYLKINQIIYLFGELIPFIEMHIFLGFILIINNKNPSSKIFTLSIYMDKGLVYFTRYYKKLPVILSNVFRILYLIFFLFKEATEFIKFCYIRKSLFELLFEKIPVDNINKVEIIIIIEAASKVI